MFYIRMNKNFVNIKILRLYLIIRKKIAMKYIYIKKTHLKVLIAQRSVLLLVKKQN